MTKGFQKGQKAWNKGLTKATSSALKRMADSKIGDKNVMKRPEVLLKSKRSHLGIRQTIQSRLKISAKLKGEKSYLWKGGLTERNKSIRNGIETRLWREAVFARDNWTCRKCPNRGGRLNAHHIKPFAQYPELRFAIDNGLTLCKKCHKKEHKHKF